MENNDVPFFGSSEWKQEYEKNLEKLLKNPPHPVNFTYTVDQLKTIYNSFTPVVDNTPGPRYIEDYYGYNEEHKPGDVNKFINSIYEFYSLENKNDLVKVETIYNTLIENSYNIQLPNEFWEAKQEINEHLNYLRDMRAISEYQQEQEKIKRKQKNVRIQQEQQLKEQQISPVERMNNFFDTINGHEQKNNNQQQETYVTLEQLEPLLSEAGYMCFGHGTGRKGNSDEVIDSIFNEGLRTKNNSLYYTTIGLSTPTPEIKEQLQELGMPEPTIEDLKNQFNNWQHQNSKKIIIARVPTEYINKAGERSDLDGEMFGAFYTQKLQPNGHETNYLDSKFIVGCFDVEKQAVRLNKNFERTLTPETIEQLKEKYKKAVEKSNARKERQAIGITQAEVDLAQESQSNIDYNIDSYDSFDNDIEWNDTSLEQDQINQLQEQITNYNNQINILIANMQPYMQIPKVKREISKVIEKNNEINSLQIIDSLQDYKTVAEIKKSLVSFLEQADRFIKDNVEKQQESVAQQQTQYQQETTQPLPDNFWNEFEPKQEQKAQQQLPNNFWDEFDNQKNNRNTRPERMYNSDGTYTMEYIAHLANTPLGFNQTIYNQLMEENELKRQQNSEQMSSEGRHR